MGIELSQTDDIYVPDDALIRSFVGMSGQSYPEGEVENIKEYVEDVVTIRTSDAEVTDVWIEGGESENQTISWRGVMSFPHTPMSIDEIKQRAEKFVDIEGSGEITSMHYGYSRPAHEYLTENWVKMDDVGDRDSSGELIEQWVHRHLLVIVGLIRFDIEGETTYSVSRLAPPVPAPYDFATYWSYGELNVAETDMYRYMLSVDGAFQQGIEDPVERADEKYSFAGTRQEWDGPDTINMHELNDVTRTNMDSLPSRPLTKDEVDTVTESYASVVGGDCTILVPEKPKFVSETVSKTINFTDGDYVSFTVVAPEKVAVFELEEIDDTTGFQWVMKEGEHELY